MSIRPFTLATLTSALLAASGSAMATNGYFAHGYGVKSQGMAGVGYALPQDALAAATNPAGTARIGNRLDVGLTVFKPDRQSEIEGNVLGPGFSADGDFDGNDTDLFYIPEFGYSRELDERLSVGLAVYGNGGMNTDYNDNPYAAYGSSGSAGVDLAQVFVTPSLAFKLTEAHAFGIGINYAYQRFEAKGLQAFEGLSGSPANVTNNGHDDSDGWGLRLGWNGQLSDSLTAGIAWSSKINTTRFKDYEGLFAHAGSFDIPENYGIGLAWQATPQLTLAADVQEIRYGQIDSVANPLSLLTPGNPLGGNNGAGFGWDDITVYKLAASYQLNPQLTLRGGVSHAEQPVPSDQTFFNILAPGVVQDHLSLGATYAVSANGEISLAYTHAFSETVNGHDSIPQNFGGGEANLKMSEDILGVAYGWKF
ncbi:OmpP1/FadL family transporter [Pseudomonas sp. N040]|uniref:OmpP1/FadL family transporter n=1 Tax=Pseudomonas sp. N040 TaxID=2785325 RepID=UPI0018A2B003|nr:outer membrane protein transport protein [Pseudomonas sp. N040]MBF7729116.1 outer membrane protein transport protein [Pseudomonas sp. N040]MBW7012756.1 outer membrane protein transport protein [Pseudomonas sp. N040]